MIDLIPPFATDPAGLAESRALFAEIPLGDLPEGVTRTELSLPGLDGAPEVRALLYRPEGSPPDRAILAFHGGGYVMGKPEMNDARNAALAAKLGCVVLAVAYRLAPENPYPAALDDALAAWRYLASGGAEIVLLGESAGAGLAAALSHRLRDSGERLPRFQALLYPMLDPRSAEEGVTAAHLGEFVWTRANNGFAWGCYLAQPRPKPPPRVRPSRSPACRPASS
ncbi:MAG: alpha/beta hydrolase fold domain-containing protein [Sphingomonas sp.]